MVRVSARFRGMLRERCLRLLESGFNCLPKWADSKAPAFRRGESYAAALSAPVEPDSELGRLILSRFDDPRVGGLAVAAGVGGVAAVDYDPAKLSRSLWRRAAAAAEEMGFVYSDTRVGRRLGGFHFVLRLPGPPRRLRVDHGFQAEFAVKTLGLVTVSPSLLVSAGEASVYIQVSPVDLPETIYDRDLKVLPVLVERLGGRLRVSAPADPPPAAVVEESGSQVPAGVRPRGLDDSTVFCFLKTVYEAVGCRGAAALVEALERGVWPVPYAIYADLVDGVGHPRSTWTLAENCLFHFLRLLGVTDPGDPAAARLLEAVSAAEAAWAKVNGPVDHSSLRDNAARALAGRAFGSCASGACVFHLAGLEDREEHTLRCLDYRPWHVEEAAAYAAKVCTGGR